MQKLITLANNFDEKAFQCRTLYTVHRTLYLLVSSYANPAEPSANNLDVLVI